MAIREAVEVAYGGPTFSGPSNAGPAATRVTHVGRRRELLRVLLWILAHHFASLAAANHRHEICVIRRREIRDIRG